MIHGQQNIKYLLGLLTD